MRGDAAGNRYRLAVGAFALQVGHEAFPPVAELVGRVRLFRSLPRSANQCIVVDLAAGYCVLGYGCYVRHGGARCVVTTVTYYIPQITVFYTD